MARHPFHRVRRLHRIRRGTGGPGPDPPARTTPTRRPRSKRTPVARFATLSSRSCAWNGSDSSPKIWRERTIADAGTLVHEILREFMEAWRERPLGEIPRDELQASLLAVAEKRIAAFEEDHATGFRLRWAVDKACLRDDLLSWLDFGEIGRTAASRGVFEVAFGSRTRPGEAPAPEATKNAATLELAGGRRVAFHGRSARFRESTTRRGSARG